MTALVDTNVLVYRFDSRDSAKQRVAREDFSDGQLIGTVRIRNPFK